jgi:hypothetical protein
MVVVVVVVVVVVGRLPGGVGDAPWISSGLPWFDAATTW